VRSASWGEGGELLLPDPRPLLGPPIAIGRIRPASVPLDSFLPPDSPHWRVRAALSYLDRALLGGILLVLAGYVALVVPAAKSERAVLLTLFFFPVVGSGTVWCMTLLWAYELRGIAAEAVWLALLVGLLAVLDRTYARVGLRAA